MWNLVKSALLFNEVQQASSKAFAGLAQLMTGLSTLELANDAEAKTHLATAVTTMKAAAGEFQVLAEKNANVTLEVKFPDALAELAQTLEVSAENYCGRCSGTHLSITGYNNWCVGEVRY